MYCMNCGAKIPEGAAFCECCGTPVNRQKNAPVERQGVNAKQVVKLLVCALGGFLMAFLVFSVTDVLIPERGEPHGPLMLLFMSIHLVPLFVLFQKPFSRKLGTGYGMVAAFGAAIGMSFVLMGSLWVEEPLLWVAGLLYAIAMYVFGERFGKKEK